VMFRMKVLIFLISQVFLDSLVSLEDSFFVLVRKEIAVFVNESVFMKKLCSLAINFWVLTVFFTVPYTGRMLEVASASGPIRMLRRANSEE